jgi:hypothetical protein
MNPRVLASTAAVVFCGSLLHFAWEWSGQSWIVGLFAAINESVWEHLKLAFWPALMLSPVQRVLYGPCPGWWPAISVRCVLPTLLIPILFYGYTGLIGHHWLPADLAIFVVAVFAGEQVGHTLLQRHWSRPARVASATILLAAAGAFSTLTYLPPDLFLFDAPA